MAGIPPPSTTDSDDVVWALQTAATQWERGEQRDAAAWLQRAARAASDAGDDDRAVELGRRAAELLDSFPPPVPQPDASSEPNPSDDDAIALSSAIAMAVTVDDDHEGAAEADDEVVTSAPPLVTLDPVGAVQDARLKDFRTARAFVGVRDAKPFIDAIEREAESASDRPKRRRPPPPPPIAARKPPAPTALADADSDGVEVVVAAEEPSSSSQLPAPEQPVRPARRPPPPPPAATRPPALETSEPSTAGPSSLEPVSLEPLSLEPLSLEPLSLEPVSLEPVSLEPVSLEPVSLEPLSLEPISSELDEAEQPSLDAAAGEAEPARPADAQSKETPTRGDAPDDRDSRERATMPSLSGEAAAARALATAAAVPPPESAMADIASGTIPAPPDLPDVLTTAATLSAGPPDEAPGATVGSPLPELDSVGAPGAEPPSDHQDGTLTHTSPGPAADLSPAEGAPPRPATPPPPPPPPPQTIPAEPGTAPEPEPAPQPAVDVRSPAASSSVPASAPLVSLAAFDAFADVPEEELAHFEAQAEVQRVARDEEVAGFGLALVIDGELNVSAIVSDFVATRIGPASVLRMHGTVPGAVEVRLVCATRYATLATWSEDVVQEAFGALPWVEEELLNRADRVHALVGATLGPLGQELDSGLLAELAGHMTVRVLVPQEQLVEEGGALPGLIVVGLGLLEQLAESETEGQFMAGDFVFPSAVLQGSVAPATVRAGPDGAVLLCVDRTVTQELFMTFPPLLDLLLHL